MVRMAMKMLAAIVAALTFAGPAAAYGGSFTMDGGTAADQQQIRAALDASSFNFDVLPTITVHIVPTLAGPEAGESKPGEIWFSELWLGWGQLSWGFVQHEFAHEVDFLLLNDNQREAMRRLLGASAWYEPGLSHEAQGRERFASTLAWAFWPSSQNSQSPTRTLGESGHVSPIIFRAKLSEWGLAPVVRRCRVVRHVRRCAILRP